MSSKQLILWQLSVQITTLCHTIYKPQFSADGSCSDVSEIVGTNFIPVIVFVKQNSTFVSLTAHSSGQLYCKMKIQYNITIQFYVNQEILMQAEVLDIQTDNNKRWPEGLVDNSPPDLAILGSISGGTGQRETIMYCFFVTTSVSTALVLTRTMHIDCQFQTLLPLLSLLKHSLLYFSKTSIFKEFKNIFLPDL